MIDLKNKSLLVTGGTGSFGCTFVESILHKFPDLDRLIIFSRDEFKQSEMAQRFPAKDFPQLKFALGDIRDRERLDRVLKGVDIVVHAAALKQVPTAEANPMEFVKTNVLGSENLINAAIHNHVKSIVALSSDKACSPASAYGASKLCADKLFIAANLEQKHTGLTTSVVRYGNIFGSRGSVLPHFLENVDRGYFQITHPEMSRFHTSRGLEVDLVLHAMSESWGGEIFVPKLPSFRVRDLASAISPNTEQRVTGIRKGEKLHEEMITQTDAFTCIEYPERFVVLPNATPKEIEKYISSFGGTPTKEGFYYSSSENKDWLTIDSIREEIVDYLNPKMDSIPLKK